MHRLALYEPPPRNGRKPARGEHRAYLREAAACAADAAELEVEVENSLDVAVQQADALHEVGERAVAVGAALLRRADLFVEAVVASRYLREESEQPLRRALAVGRVDERADGDGSGVHERVRRLRRGHLDAHQRVERVGARLHADVAEYVRRAEVLDREGERERLRDRLHREEALRVARLHRFAAGRRAAQREELRRRQRELRYIVRRLAVRGHHARDVHNFVEKSFIKFAVLHFMRSSFAARRAIFLFLQTRNLFRYFSREAAARQNSRAPPKRGALYGKIY